MPVNLNYKCAAIYGKVILRAWFEPVDDKLVGMGAKSTVNEEGILTDYNEDPTGVVMFVGEDLGA